jgi:excinuclease ABC subunit A
MYVLDEPSIGLHQRDNHRLLETLKHLRDIGNTVLVVEHDEDAIRAADSLIDMGPGAGVHGGEIVAIGAPDDVFKNKSSITAQYMNGTRSIAVPDQRRSGKMNGKKPHVLKVIGAKGNNLKNITAEIPLGTLPASPAYREAANRR